MCLFCAMVASDNTLMRIELATVARGHSDFAHRWRKSECARDVLARHEI